MSGSVGDRSCKGPIYPTEIGKLRIVTRNLSDYSVSPVPVYSPHDFLMKLESEWSQNDEK